MRGKRQEAKWMLRGCLSSNGFFSLLLSSLFHLSGSLMGADLTTGAGTSAGKNGLLFSHTVVC